MAIYAATGFTFFLIGYALVPIVCETYACFVNGLESYLWDTTREFENFYASQY
jgi:hypothetical protein